MQPPLFFTSGVAAITAISGSTETVVATLGGVVTPFVNQNVTLFGQVLDTSGTTTTAVVVRIRRASLTGTLVNDQTGQTVEAAAGSTNLYEASGVDTPGEITGGIYVLTVQHTGGGTGGTTVYAILNAFVS